VITIGGPNWLEEELGKRVAKERSEKAESLLTGLCGDFADYRYAVGFADGMQRVIEIAEDIRKEQERG
jgi:hypothetical protein